MNKIHVALTSLVSLMFLLLAACTQAPAPQANPEEPTLNVQALDWLTPTLDSTGDVGQYSSIVLNSLGNPVISYYDGTKSAPGTTNSYGNGDLKLMVCGNPTCSSGNTITTVDRGTKHYTDDVGRFNSLALDSKGFPVISYYDRGNGLMLAQCGNATCTSKSIKKVTGAANITDTSLVLDSSGYPVIAVATETFTSTGTRAPTFSLVRCGNASCSIVNSVKPVEAGEYISLALNRKDEPVISYYNARVGDLVVVNCNKDCSTKNIRIVDSTGDVGQYSSLVLVTLRDVRGQITQRPLISYYDATNGDLKVVYCSDDLCSSGNAIQTVDSAGNVGQYTSLAVAASKGNPVISYYDATNQDLKVVTCDPGSPLAQVPTTPCQEKQYNTIQTVAALGNVGQNNALAVGSNGPVVSYYDATNQDLRLATQGAQGPDLIPPSVTINQHAAQPEVAERNPVLFTVQFSEPVNGFTAADNFVTLRLPN
jgi:hypothetical protein